MTADPIQEVREFFRNSIEPFIRDCQPEEDDESLRSALYYLIKQKEKHSVLIAEVERWQAIAIEELARSLVIHPDTWDNLYEMIQHPKTNAHSRDYYRKQAASELAVEASSWKKIGPEEKIALEIVVGDRPLTDDIFYMEKIRKLLEGVA